MAKGEQYSGYKLMRDVAVAAVIGAVLFEGLDLFTD